MPDPTSPQSTAPAVRAADDLRLVLFGMPAAGKTSLLGALSRAAETQEHLLGGKLIDETQSLAELRQQLYETTPRRTPEEVIPYPARFEPLPGERQSKPGPVDTVFIDCDGRVANDLLVRRKELAEDSPEGSLAREVLQADTLILVIDASAPPAQVEADFTEFSRFLKSMERGRTERTEVSGLPVFLVLTKCDLLARPGDSPADWMERIEQRKREVDAHFREFLTRGIPSPSVPLSHNGERGEKKPEAPARQIESPFGRIDLHIWATAVKRPALAGSPAKPREPYGVAELFRQCLQEATAHRARTRRASRRLWLLVGGLVVLLLAMTALTVTLWLTNQANQASLLEERIKNFQLSHPGGPAERLQGELHKDLERLQGFRADPQFPRLKAEQQTFVEDRIKELEGYLDYYEKLLKERPLTEQTERALERRLERLREDLKLPDEDWQATSAGKLYKRMLIRAEALLTGVERVRNWYLANRESAAKLWAFAHYSDAGIDWADWTLRTQKLIDPAHRLPYHELEPLPGDSDLTYANVLRFDTVADARTAWESERAKLRRLLDICSALGLATPSKERPPLLVFARGFTLEQAKDRVAELKAHYPDYLRSFVRTDLPEAVQAKVRQVAGNQYQALLEPGRAEVLRQFHLRGKGTAETVEKWEAVRKWLKAPPELASWRILARVLQKLEETDPVEPVRALVDFLDKTEFVLQPKTLVLEVPQSRDLVPRAETQLEIWHPQSGRQVALRYVPFGDPEDDRGRRVRLYTFRLSGNDRIIFKPGDNLWALLELRGGKERLMWSESRSSLYRFERLRNPPRVQSVKAASIDEGRLAEDVRLVIRPDDGVPRVPDLMPTMRE